MKNTYLRDCEDNMIFEGETLKNPKNNDLYQVMFGRYHEGEHYGFFLVDKEYGDVLAMPSEFCGRLKLLNISRG